MIQGCGSECGIFSGEVSDGGGDVRVSVFIILSGLATVFRPAAASTYSSLS